MREECALWLGSIAVAFRAARSPEVPGAGPTVVGGRRAGSRAPLVYMSAVVVGAVLFFLCFAAAFNGSWTLLVIFMLCYGLAWLGGALGRRKPRSVRTPGQRR